MDATDLDQFLARDRAVLARGPVALIFIEDAAEIGSTLEHARKAGFRTIVAFRPPGVEVPPGAAEGVRLVAYRTLDEGAVPRAVNAVIAAAPPGTWFYWGYNAEYLFHPFCETRNVRELLAFHAEERRDAMLAYVIDLYAADLTRNPDAVAPDAAMLDRAGYYALARKDPARNYEPRERQLDFFGGLRWRFEEHMPWTRRRIDRIALFRSAKGLRLRDDFTFSDEEYNTYACPWHNNLTACVASFRTAKALRANPGSRHAIPTFRWHQSVPFEWSSQQLLDLGLMEPGQWF